MRGRGGAAAVSERIGLESLPSDGKLSRSAHSLRVVHALREAIVSGGMAGRRAARRDRDRPRPRRQPRAGAHRAPRAARPGPRRDHADRPELGRRLRSRAPARPALGALAARVAGRALGARAGAQPGGRLRRVRRDRGGRRRVGRGGRRARHGVPPGVDGVLGQPRADERVGRPGAGRDDRAGGRQPAHPALGAAAQQLVRDLHTPLIDGLMAVDADEIARLLQRQFEGTDYLRQVRPDVPTLTPPPPALA